MKKLVIVPRHKKTHSYTLSSPGDYVFFLFNVSGTLTLRMNARGANAYIFGAYVGKKKEHFHIETVQHHTRGENISDLFIKGAFFDSSRFEYEGLIRIDKGADLSHAYQKNQNLMLSNACFVDSRPFLEILANDVFCTHGSTTGKLDQEQLYYLATRGMSKKDARSLLIEGFFNEIFQRMESFIPHKEAERLRKKTLSLVPSS